MSTTLHPPGYVIFDTVVHPATLEESDVSITVDCNGRGYWCCAIQNVGAITGTSPTLDGKMQESNDQSIWTDIGGAAFTQVTAENNTQIIEFMRTKRYVRHSREINGTTPTFAIGVLLGVATRPSLFGGAL